MKIFYWTADRSGCAYYRCVLPAQALRKLGHEASWSQYLDPSIKARDHGYDILVGQRISEPGPSFLWQRLAREGTVKCVFELDDDFWHIDPANKDAHTYYTPESLDRFVKNIEVADLVTVSTSTLAEVVAQWNPNVVVLSNHIPARLLDAPAPVVADVVTIGYTASPSHQRDFGEVAKPLKRVLQRYRDFAMFHMIGADFTPRVFSTKSHTIHTPWIASVDNYFDNIDFHVGLAPLFASPFNESKSYIKVLEYAALGIPAVASDVGPYRRAKDDGAPVLLSRSPKDWETNLKSLIDSSQRRRELGEQARAWASKHTIDNGAANWEKAYSS